MEDIVQDMALYDFLTGNSPRTYRRYIQVAMFLLQRPMIRKITEKMDGEEMKARMRGISHFDDRSLFSSRTEEGSLPVRAASKYVRNPVKHRLFHAPSPYKSRSGHFRELHGFY